MAAASVAQAPKPRLSRSEVEAGFLLLEVLIALLIGVLVVAALVRGAAEGRSAVRAALDTEEAIVRARSRMATLDRGGLVAGQRDGDDGDGFTWHTRIIPIATTTTERAHASQFSNSLMPRETLFAVTVAIEWRREGTSRHFELESQRLGPLPEP